MNTGDRLRLGIIFSAADNILYIIELAVGFEGNLHINTSRKELKYRPLQADLDKAYDRIKFINLCISSLGIYGNSSDSFLQMCHDIGIDKHHLNFIATKLSTIIIRTTYYIFCMRNKPWGHCSILGSDFSDSYACSLKPVKYKLPVSEICTCRSNSILMK